jgi:hypothetical protein
MIGTALDDKELQVKLRRVEALPANRENSDKTWVLHLMRRLERLTREARALPGRGPHGSVRRSL